MKWKPRVIIALVMVVWVLVAETHLGAERPHSSSFGDPLRLDPGQKQLDPTSSFWILEDPENTLHYDDVIGDASSRFRPVKTDLLNLGYSSSTFWLRVEVDRSEASSDGWLLEIAYALLDDVQLYIRGDGGSRHVVRTGDHLPFDSREVKTPTFVFGLPDELGEQLEVHLRIRSSGTINVPLTLWREDGFNGEIGWRELTWGLYFGLILALGLYNLFLWTAVRDRMYLYYVGYLTGVGGFQASLSGHAFQHLWPDAPGFASLTPGIFLVLFTSLGLLFVREVVAVATTSPRLYRPMALLAWAPVIAMPSLLIDYSIGIQVLTALAVVVLLVLPWPVVRAYRQGYRPARYIALALMSMVPAWFILSLRHAGLDVDSTVIIHAVQLATAADAIMLSFALADRINLLRRDEAAAQTRSLEAEKRALEAQQNLSQRLIEAQDEERRRMASELHDGMGQSMLVLCNGLARLARRGAHEGEAEPLAVMAKQTVGELRVMSHNLHPHKLDRLGLAEAIESTIEDARYTSGIDGMVHIDNEIEASLSTEAQLHLYRIAQEAIANAIRHGDATEIMVSLKQGKSRLELRIQDNGSNAPSDLRAGLGLTSMKERARLLNGEARFVSQRGEGVTVEVDVPIEGREKE